MAVQKIRQRQTDYATGVYDSTTSTDIRASGALTRIILRAHILVGTSTMISNHFTDAVWRIFDSIRVKGAGGVSYFSLGDHECGIHLHLLNMYDKTINGTGHGKLVNFTEYTDAVFVLHFGSRPRDEYGRDNPFDLTAFIPAFDDAELKLEISHAAELCMDGSGKYGSSPIYITTFQVFGTKGDILQEMARQRVQIPAGAGGNCMIPVSTYISEAHLGTKTDFSYEKDVPTGTYLRRISILELDASTPNTRMDDQVTALALKLPQSSQRLIQEDLAALTYTQGSIESLQEADVAVTTGVQQTGPGWGVLDLRQHADPDYGFNLMPYGPGAVKLGMTMAYNSGEDTYLWYDQVRPYRF